MANTRSERDTLPKIGRVNEGKDAVIKFHYLKICFMIKIK